MSSTRRRIAAARLGEILLAGLLAAVLSACAPSAGVGPNESSPSGGVGPTGGATAGVKPPVGEDQGAPLLDGVTVALRQARSDVAQRRAAVTVRNDTDRVLIVGEVSVDDPRFTSPAVRVLDTTTNLAPGAGVDIRVQLSAVECTAPDDAAATLTLDYDWGGDRGVAVVPISDPIPFVSALHAGECVRANAERSADIDFGAFRPSRAGAPAELEVVVTPRTGAGSLRILGIRETNLLTIGGAVDGVAPLDLDQTGADRMPQRVAVQLTPARCDPHVVQEDKRGTVFRVLVEVDGREGSFDLAASEELRGEILSWVAVWCGFGE